MHHTADAVSASSIRPSSASGSHSARLDVFAEAEGMIIEVCGEVFGPLVIAPQEVNRLMAVMSRLSGALTEVRILYRSGQVRALLDAVDLDAPTVFDTSDVSAVVVESAGRATELFVRFPVDVKDSVTYRISASAGVIAGVEEELCGSIEGFLRWNTGFSLPERALALWTGPLMIMLATAGLLCYTVLPGGGDVLAGPCGRAVHVGTAGAASGFAGGIAAALLSRRMFPWTVVALCRRGQVSAMCSRVLHAGVSLAAAGAVFWYAWAALA